MNANPVTNNVEKEIIEAQNQIRLALLANSVGGPALSGPLAAQLGVAAASVAPGGQSQLAGSALGATLPSQQAGVAAELHVAAATQQAAAAAELQAAVGVAGTSNPFLAQQAAAAGLIGQAAGGLVGQNAAVTIPSAAAIQTLSNTAQSLGMTLEQFASKLASASDLKKKLSGTDAEKLHELALRLYQSEVRALYQRCMLLAGFPAEEATDESSQVHLEFALNAWQLEGKRLQELMGNENAEEFNNNEH